MIIKIPIVMRGYKFCTSAMTLTIQPHIKIIAEKKWRWYERMSFLFRLRRVEVAFHDCVYSIQYLLYGNSPWTFAWVIEMKHSIQGCNL